MIFQKHILVMLMLLQLVESQDPCDIATDLSNIETRLADNRVPTLNDFYMTEGWYRIPLRKILETDTDLQQNSCGAKYPVYIKGSTLDMSNLAEQSLNVCVGVGGTCAQSFTIKGKVCGSDLVYHLTAPTSQAAYCIGPRTEGDMPDVTFTPQVIGDAIGVSPSLTTFEVQFLCNFTNQEQQLFYTIYWYVNNKLINTTSPVQFNQLANSILTEGDLIAHGITSAGFEVSCRVGSSLTETSAKAFSEMSEKQFVGIKVLDPVIHVNEGEEKFVNLTLEGPIGCDDGNCFLDITMSIPEEERGTCDQKLKTTACGQRFEAPFNRQLKIKVIGTPSQTYTQATTITKIVLYLPSSYQPQPFPWTDGVISPPITVYVSRNTTMIERAYCRIYADPYIRTFDRGNLLSLQQTGTFTLYENKYENIQVQVRTFVCAVSEPTNGYCTCSVAVRVGRTIFMIDKCSLDYWFIDYVLCDDGMDVMDVQNNGNDYEIKLNTGMDIRLSLRLAEEQINVYIKPSVIDFNSTEGLCGNFNNINTDDGYGDEDEYFRRWSVGSSSSLFRPGNYKDLESTSRSYSLCSCNAPLDGGKVKKEFECGSSSESACNEDKGYKEVHKKQCLTPDKPARFNRRRRRSVPEHIDTGIRRIKRSTEWMNGWTEESARNYCESLFANSSLIQICKTIPGIESEGAILSCQLDIKASGSTMFALSAIESVRQQCGQEVKMNPVLHETPKDGGKSVKELVSERRCIYECSHNGICQNGECQCYSDYIGGDCSIKKSYIPSLKELLYGGYCDIDMDESCNDTTIYGGLFIDTPDSLCRLTHLEVGADGHQIEKGHNFVRPEVASVGEVICPLINREVSEFIPENEDRTISYRVAVSNNGQDFSQELTLAVINSKCMTCNISDSSVTCQFSKSHCVSNGHCYKDGEKHLNNPDYICKIYPDSKVWETTRIKIDESDNTYIIIGSVVGSIVLLLIIAGIVGFICARKHTRAKIGS